MFHNEFKMAAWKVFKLNKLLNYTIRSYLQESRRQSHFNKYFKIRSFQLRERQQKYFESLDPQEELELSKRSNFLEWNYSSEVYAFGKRLQENFFPELLVQAFTHRSYVEQQYLKLKEVGVDDINLQMKDNELLASSGEKIISNYVFQYLSYFFPRFPLEGINAVHDYLTSEELLAHVSKNLGTTFLILASEYPVESSTYAKTFKALVGALHQCQGLTRANLFVRDFIVAQLVGQNVSDFLIIENPLEVLNEILKRDGKKVGEPRMICQSAVNTILANYHVGIYSNKQLIGHSSGETIETATEMAAMDALKRLFHTTDSNSPLAFDIEDIPESKVNLSLNEWHSAAFEKKR